MIVRLLLYGYSVGILSPWKLEKATYQDIPFRVLTVWNNPDHSRISEFPRKHLDELGDLFLQVLQICLYATGGGGQLTVEGTKVQDSASKHMAMSHERMLEEEDRLKNNERFGRQNRVNELPKESGRQRDRREKIQGPRQDCKRRASKGAQRKFRSKRIGQRGESRPARAKESGNAQRRWQRRPTKRPSKLGTSPTSRLGGRCPTRRHRKEC